jgi:TolB protein
MRIDGAADRVLMEIDGFGAGVLSPDGTRLAFTRCDMEGDELDCEIWLAEGDGRSARPLVDSEGRDSDPVWSPDGARLAFVSDRDRNGACLFHDCWGHNGEIYVMEADGSGQTRVTDDPGDDQGPTWSPDGSQIAFAALRNIQGAIDEEDYEIYAMAADGSDVRQLTDNDAWDVDPDWR